MWATRVEKVFVGGLNSAIHPEFDDCLGLVDRRKLALEVRRGHFLVSDDRRILHDFERFAAQVEDRIVAGLNPNLHATFADPLVLARVELTAPKLVPEQTVGLAGPLRRVDEHAMMLAADFLQGVTERGEKVLIRRLNLAVHPEFDDCLDLADRRELALKVRRGHLLPGYDGSVFDDLERLAVRVQDRVVAGLDPDFTATFADPSIFACIELAAAELVPEQAIAGAGPIDRVDENAMMLTSNFIKRVAQRGEKVLIRGQYFAIEAEFDHCLGLADRRKLTLMVDGRQCLFGNVASEFGFVSGDTEKPRNLPVPAGDRHEGDPQIDRAVASGRMG